MYSEERAISPRNFHQQMSKGTCNLIPSCFIKGCFQTLVIIVFAKLLILSFQHELAYTLPLLLPRYTFEKLKENINLYFYCLCTNPH